LILRKKPSSFMRNLMMGTKYLEHVGTMTIENVADQSQCVLDFKQSGYWAPSNVVTGTITDANSDVQMELEGKWDDQFSQTMSNSHLRVLWRATPWPKNTEAYYGFTSYGVTLNEITNDVSGKLPPTDSRYRPDVRALEEGEVDLAEEEKQRVEEMQRERRRRGADRQPRWFKQIGDEWIYVGGYWEARAKGWKGEKIEPLW
jgi:oxysterol-binding protein-related protein 3/6/7